jgi:microtubule-associated protein-like 6
MAFHRDHSDQVFCSAVHPTRSLVATGQQGKAPSVLVWDYRGTLKPAAAAVGERPPTKETLVALTGAHRRGVSHLCFSRCGRYLASTGLDDWHALVVHDWEAGAVLLNRPTSKDTVFDLQFVPPLPPRHASEEDEQVPSPPLELVQVGSNVLRFWTLGDGGHNASWQSATLGPDGQWQTFLCVGFVGADPWAGAASAAEAAPAQKPRANGMRTVVGCQDGSLYLFAGSRLSQAVPAHSGPVNVLSCQGDLMATGGHDGLIKVLH